MPPLEYHSMTRNRDGLGKRSNGSRDYWSVADNGYRYISEHRPENLTLATVHG
jgi:hypothetical protein